MFSVSFLIWARIKFVNSNNEQFLSNNYILCLVILCSFITFYILLFGIHFISVTHKVCLNVYNNVSE